MAVLDDNRFYPSLLAPGSGDDLRIDLRLAPDLPALEGLLTRLTPQLLLVDLRWLARLDVDVLQAHRQRHSDTRWMVACSGPDPKLMDWLICSRAMGCVDWAMDRSTLVRALTAVMRGELWFPRAVMQQLYLTLLLGRDSADAPANDQAKAMSTRQVQTFSLLREGLSNKEIAVRLGVSVNTVKKHLAQAFERSGVHKRRQLTVVNGAPRPSDRVGLLPDWAIAPSH